MSRQWACTKPSLPPWRCDGALLNPSCADLYLPHHNRVNAELKIDVHKTALTPLNAIELLQPYDIILDCTDNMPTRYLLSDAAVALGKPLVSGAAQKLEGQMCIYNLGEKGPCYRCLYPRPPPPAAVGTCEELGILGVVTGVIGNMQALETIKIIVGVNSMCLDASLARLQTDGDANQTLPLLFCSSRRWVRRPSAV